MKDQPAAFTRSRNVKPNLETIEVLIDSQNFFATVYWVNIFFITFQAIYATAR